MLLVVNMSPPGKLVRTGIPHCAALSPGTSVMTAITCRDPGGLWSCSERYQLLWGMGTFSQDPSCANPAWPHVLIQSGGLWEKNLWMAADTAMASQAPTGQLGSPPLTLPHRLMPGVL